MAAPYTSARCRSSCSPDARHTDAANVEVQARVIVTIHQQIA
jgi:hypothetical protein